MQVTYLSNNSAKFLLTLNCM